MKTNETSQLLPPIILNYEDYRMFIRDFYDFKKSQKSTFSFRRFAQLAGIKSSNYLMLVMQGKRNLSEQTALAVAQAMQLKSAERTYFVGLVKKANAQSPEAIEEATRDLLRATRKMVSKQIPQEKAEFLSQWHHTLVRELVFLPDFEFSGTWISSRLRGLISPEQAENSLRILVDLGLIKKEGERFVPVDTFVDTGPEDVSFASINISNIHVQHFLAWASILPELPVEERELGLLNIPIHSSKIPEFKKRIQKFQDEIIGWLQSEKNPDQIVQLGTYLIPTSKKSIEN
jgi:uncharacterized protein (TIGR02147 family)